MCKTLKGYKNIINVDENKKMVFLHNQLCSWVLMSLVCIREIFLPHSIEARARKHRSNTNVEEVNQFYKIQNESNVTTAHRTNVIILLPCLELIEMCDGCNRNGDFQ